MKIEDIEKAAKSYQEKDHDIWTGKGMATELQKAFKAGANWRIGSVASYKRNAGTLSSCYIHS